MRSLRNDADREAVVARIARLSAATPARWGRMRAPEMLAHLTQSMRMATGDLPVASKRVFLRLPPFKQLAMYWLPLPKGLPTAPELLTRRPSVWNAEVATLRDALDEFARRPADAAWPLHPVFGELDARQWGVQQYRHFDHHLRQFGV